MRGKDYGVPLAQEVEGARPRHGYLRRGASSVGRWSCRKFEPEFYVQTYQEHAAWRLALRVGRRAEEIDAEGNNKLRKLQPTLNEPRSRRRKSWITGHPIRGNVKRHFPPPACVGGCFRAFSPQPQA